MVAIAFDFQNTSILEFYPKHGWSENSQGVKLLWLPIISVIAETDYFRTKNQLSKLNSKQQHEIASFYYMLKNLCITLRELGRCLDQNIELQPLLNDMAAIHIENTFGFLRRLADRLAYALRFRLFSHVASAPSKFAALLDSDISSLDKNGVLVNSTSLFNTLQRHKNWFETIRDTDGKKGVRDFLEHRPHSINVNLYKVDENNWDLRASVYLQQEINGSNLMLTIRQIIPEFSAFLTALSKCILEESSTNSQTQQTYKKSDCLVIQGNDKNITEYWPTLSTHGN